LGELLDGKLMEKNKQLLDQISDILYNYELGEKKDPNKHLSC
jgi:hypothetical protein